MNTESINFPRLLNVEHVSLAKKIVATTKKHMDGAQELQPLVARLEPLVDFEVHTFNVMNASTFTTLKSEADAARDNAVRFLVRYVGSFEFSDDEQEKQAASLLHEVLKDATNIIYAANEKETELLNTMVGRLRQEPYAAAVVLLGAADRLQKVADKNAAFDNISAQQTEADSGKDSGNMNAVRKPVDTMLRKLFKALESRFDLELANDQLKAMMQEINYDIREANTKMHQRLGKTVKKEGEAS